MALWKQDHTKSRVSLVEHVGWRMIGLACLFMALVLAAGRAEAQGLRAPVPSSDMITASKKLLDETYGVRKATSASMKQQLAKKMLETIVANPQSPAEDRYVALTTAIELSQSARDFGLMNKAVDELVQTFQVPDDVERTRHLVQFLETAKWTSGLTLRPVFDDVTKRVRTAASERRFNDALKILVEVDAVLVELKVPASVVQPLSNLRREIETQKEAVDRYEAARLALLTTPEDPELNFVAAHYLITETNDWSRALPHLAKASHRQPWQAAAQLELMPAADGLKAGDAWWDVAATESEPLKRHLVEHVGKLYQQALPKLTGLLKMRTEQRLIEIAQMKQPVASVSKSARRQGPMLPPLEGTLPTGEWIDLLSLVKLPDHVIRGRWRSVDGTLIAEPFPDARVQAPVAVRGSYEVSCEFTRRSGREHIGLTIPVGSTATSVFVCGWAGKASGLQLIDGKDLLSQPTTNRSGVRSGLITNGRRSQLLVDVDVTGDQVTIRASLDGQRFVDWKGRTAQLSCSQWWGRPCAEAIAVTVHDSAADIHKLDLRLKPNARAVRLGDDWKNGVAPVAATPPASVADKCLTFKGRSYYFTDKPMNRTQAQELAASLEGRLLTISSAEEEAFVMNEGRGLWFWMAGWRRTEDSVWKDERNRPLKSPFRRAARQPNNDLNARFLCIRTASAWDRGWHDWTPDVSLHAIIEWGEEY